MGVAGRCVEAIDADVIHPQIQNSDVARKLRERERDCLWTLFRRTPFTLDPKQTRNDTRSLDSHQSQQNKNVSPVPLCLPPELVSYTKSLAELSIVFISFEQISTKNSTTMVHYRSVLTAAVAVGAASSTLAVPVPPSGDLSSIPNIAATQATAPPIPEPLSTSSGDGSKLNAREIDSIIFNDGIQISHWVRPTFVSALLYPLIVDILVASPPSRSWR